MRGQRQAWWLVTGVALILGGGTVAWAMVDERPDAGSSSPVRVTDRARKPRAVPGELLVKFKPSLTQCAHCLLSQQRRFASAVTGASDSLDQLNARFNVRGARSVFVQRHHLSTAQAQVMEAQRAAKLAVRDRSLAARSAGAQRPDLTNTYVLELAKDTPVEEAAAAYRADPHVAYAEPNYLRTAQDFPRSLPDDTYVDPNHSRAWSTGAWGQAHEDLWGAKTLQADRAWALTQGEGVVVAVIDSGVDYLHNDLAPNIWTNPGEIPDNRLDDDGNGFIDDVRGWDFVSNDADPMDDNGHGTHVAGTIAAVGNNTYGIIGVAPKAKIMPVKFLDAGGGGPDADAAAAVRYAVDAGAAVLNNSWGGPGDSLTLREAFAYAAASGALSVAAAGNDGTDADWLVFAPASFETLLSVAAVDIADRRCDFSNWGMSVDVSAPGGGSRSTDGTNLLGANILSMRSNNRGLPTGNPQLVVGSEFYRARGTSMACPHAAGVAALLFSKYPSESLEAIRGRLLAGTQPIDAFNPDDGGLLGAGRLDAYQALTLAPQPVLTIESIQYDPLIPGRSVNMTITLRDRGQPASGVVATLTTSSPSVTFQRSTVSYGDIAVGETKGNDAAPFLLTVLPNTPLGTVLPFTLTLSASGTTTTRMFTRRVTLFAAALTPSGLPLNEMATLHTNLGDVDNDGDLDAFVIDHDSGQLFRNNGDGTFTGVDPKVTGVLLHYASVFLDVDNDGDQDLFVTGEAGRLFLNQGDGTFTDFSVPSGLGGVRSYQVVAVDYNKDGWVDLVDGDVYKNNGDRTFTQVTAQAGLPGAITWDGGFLAAFDYDNDGDQDIMVGGRFYRNNGSGAFAVSLTAAQLVQLSPPWPALLPDSGAAVGDYNNDGAQDVFMTGMAYDPAHCFVNDCPAVRWMALCKNNGNGTYTPVTGAGLSKPGAGTFYGTQFLDYDHDGDLDLYMVNGGEINMTTGLPGVSHNFVWRNNGDDTFTEVTEYVAPWELRPWPGASAAAVGDQDNNGTLDFIAPGSLVFMTRGALLNNVAAINSHWLKIKLRGTTSARDAYGARVSVKTGARTQVREAQSASSVAQPHFGIGASTLIDAVEIRWPSGIVNILRNVPADQVLTVTEKANRPPVFTPINRQAVFESRALTFRIQATDPDGDSLTYTVDAGTVPAGATLSNQTFRWQTDFFVVPGRERNSRIMPVTFYVTDGTETVPLTVDIEVHNMDIDVNRDGAINALDQTVTGQAASGLISDDAIRTRADFNRSGSVTTTDWVWSGIVVKFFKTRPPSFQRR
ncbi:MAG: S8 family serine peptidase [Candidatus Omnitrophica bacterium]|nr:S8 family serine peptidase [Candidatus Omnitrophota bacterium]